MPPDPFSVYATSLQLPERAGYHGGVRLLPNAGNRMPIAKPGASLKQLRKTNGWTLADVSKRTGIPPSTLSRIENDRVSPTYDLLARLSQGLSVDVAQLVSSAESPAAAASEQRGRRSLNRIGDGELIEMSNHTLRYLSTDLLKKQVTPI